MITVSCDFESSGLRMTKRVSGNILKILVSSLFYVKRLIHYRPYIIHELN